MQINKILIYFFEGRYDHLQLLQFDIQNNTTKFSEYYFVLSILATTIKKSTRAGLNPDPRRCDCFSSAGSSKIKIRTSSSWHKFRLALCHDEVRILIFDDTAE
jgi:hypothetical protein